ncbi:cytochrome c biogenesis protein CcsA [Candidatus Uabimicrobium sp. HlEnr_7]|uniref:cytochrome c biogenesis protein CcsA n=1 Tax=Candidatus Uabimicrobium helgolandensis TaxID=3095367 RepID=UPI0035580227
MFDLENKIKEWRQELSTSETFTTEIIDELEDHLRNECQNLKNVDKQQAWEMAVKKLGSQENLKQEYAKTYSLSTTDYSIYGFGFVCIALFWLVVLPRIFQKEILLSIHVATIIIAYTTVFLVGFFSVCNVFRRNANNYSQKKLKQISHKLYYLALFSMLVAFVSGTIWAQQNIGRMWGGDAKEIGGLICLVWCAAIVYLRNSPKLNHITYGIIGNIVVSLSWFVPVAAQNILLVSFVISQIMLICYFYFTNSQKYSLIKE